MKDKKQFMESETFRHWVSDYRNENMILCGLRYSLGRSTYQCGDGCELFESLIPILSDRAINIAWRDCRAELFQYARVPRGICRDECDLPYIRKLLQTLDKEMDQRNLFKDRRDEYMEDLDILDVRPLKVKKLNESARIPAYSHEGDACFDFFLPADDTVPPYAVGHKVPLGIAVEIPKGYFLKIFVRSSTGLKTPLRLSNAVGIVDEGYRGELCLILDNLRDEAVQLAKGQRIAQGMLRWKVPIVLEAVNTLTESDRGVGGFGSSGK